MESDTETEPPPEVKKPPFEWQRIHRWIKERQVYVSMAILAVAIIGAFFSFQNYRLQQLNATPLLVVKQISLHDKGQDTFSYNVTVENIGGLANSITVSISSVGAKDIIPISNHPVGNPLEKGMVRDLIINPKPMSSLLPVLFICMEYQDSNNTRYERQLFYNATRSNPQERIWATTELSTQDVAKLVAKNYCNQVKEYWRQSSATQGQ